MKLLSVVIPCYNAEEYMRYCIESLLIGGEQVEILIVNDGSTDETANIANDYEKQYPNIVKAIHQENGGHGEAINTGMKHASGKYFKVVDSDDWVDTRAYLKIINVLKRFIEEEEKVDMIVSNFVYEKEGAKYKKVMRYENVFPREVIVTWNDINKFRKGQYLLMHSIIYRTQLLIDCQLELPKHTFYVDNLYVYQPLERVKKIYYINVDFYRYYIGREDQSVNERVMVKRVDQQIKVNKLMIDHMSSVHTENQFLRHYLHHHLEIVTVISMILLIKAGDSKNLLKKKHLWKYMKEKDVMLYRDLRYGVLGHTINLPGKVGRGITIYAYKLSRKLIGFN